MLLNPLSAYASESDYVDVASEEGVVTDGYLQDGYYDDVIGVEKFVAPIEISNQKDKSTRASASADVSFYIHHIFYPSALQYRTFLHGLNYLYLSQTVYIFVVYTS